MSAETQTVDAPASFEAEQPPQNALTPASAMPPAPAGPQPREFSRVTMEHLIKLPDDEHRRNWIQALVEAEVARQTYAYDRSLAREFALCGKFDDIKGSTQEQAIATAMAKIQLGRSWGFSPADSMRYVYFVGGRPSIENDIVASRLQQAGISWDPEWDYEEAKDGKGKVSRVCTGCTLWLKRYNPGTKQYEPMKDRKGRDVSVSFLKSDAERAKVYEKGQTISLSDKAMYQGWPQNMFYWRAISNVRRFYAPHVLRGGTTKEEAWDVIPGDAPPEMLPPPEAGQSSPAQEPAAEQPPQKLRDRVLNQPSFLEPGEPGGK